MALSGGWPCLWKTCRTLPSRIRILYPAGAAVRSCSSRSLELVPRTSLSRPPWPELSRLDLEEERRRHAAVVVQVNRIIAQQDFGRLFAVVFFASRQWKVTDEDLIQFTGHIDAECGDRIRMEKVLMVGAQDFSLIGRPLLGRDLVRVEATVLEKTESWPLVHMCFWRRHRFQRKRFIVRPQTVLRINRIELAPNLA
ncbi:39S ribosomal protein L21, mitochondrial [Thalassophryne amazonica]|uniref:39S ribosomal protein L21, mitochondrial n=1 Tax=Thalassophryne amazonica TaxID=390379 RepID=UPI0014713B55|nr:39S ribosomal protein L21, mitochondrial [Thalassophryne amazonica]